MSNKSETEGDLTEGEGGGNVPTETEIRVMHPQVKECWQPPENGKATECEEIIFFCFKPPYARNSQKCFLSCGRMYFQVFWIIKFSTSLPESIKALGHWFGINSNNYHHSFWNHYISMKLKLTSLDFLDSCFFLQ